VVADPTAYRRGRVTWVAFAALFAFGLLNALLGPVLPYLRAAEGISYVTGALHQAAFAVGGGLAGILAARERNHLGRRATICLGLLGAALACVVLGYGDTAAVTVTAAFLISALATAALIRIWAVLSVIHHQWRAVALSEGEVCVSVAGILAPVLIGGLAATTLGWQFGFVVTAAVVGAAAVLVGLSPIPLVSPTSAAERRPTPAKRGPRSTLVIVFAIVALEFTLSFWVASFLNDDVGIARNTAVTTVSGLYAANLAGRLLTSRLAHHASAETLLAGALGVTMVGLPILLTATGPVSAGVGLAICGVGIGATFPLTSSMHIAASPRSPDSALGEVLVVASVGQLAGPLAAGALAEATGLRVGLVLLPALTLVAATGLVFYQRISRGAPLDAELARRDQSPQWGRARPNERG
jgi:fucose permease